MPKEEKKKVPELQLIEAAWNENTQKSKNVSEMEELVHNFDVAKILKLNEKIRAYYKKKGDVETLELIDRMTLVMNELTEIIHEVKAKRISLESAQKEILEKLKEVNEVLQTLKDWGATGI